MTILGPIEYASQRMVSLMDTGYLAPQMHSDLQLLTNAALAWSLHMRQLDERRQAQSAVLANERSQTYDKIGRS